MKDRTVSGRRRLRIFFIVLLLIALVIFAGLLAGHISTRISEKELQDATALIGGADGPTAIFTAGRSSGLGAAIVGALLLAASVISIIMTRQK